MRDILSKLDSIKTSEVASSRNNRTTLNEGFEIDREELKPAHDKGYRDAANGIDKNPFNPDSPAFKSYREGQMAYKRSFGESIFQVGDEFGISFSEDFEISTQIVGFVADGIVVELDNYSLDLLEGQGLSFLEGELQEGVAGPKKCWPGHRKVGTQPGTGKNAGKPVNKCKKIGEDHSEDPEDPENYSEYDNEGDMAKDDLRTINDAAQELYDILDSDDNLPEWVQAKITKAVDYIDTVRDYTKANNYAEDAQTNEAEYQGRKVPLGKKMAGDVKKSKVYVRKPNGKVVKVNFGDKKMKIKKSNPARRKSFRARHNCANPGPRHKARYWSCRSW
jgi:hypothetical protein